MAHTDRVVILVDMDCFYCQVEEKLDPTLCGKPVAVVQYNAWKGGGIIAVNYIAKNKGVTRHMRGDEAKEKCPDIELVRVPNVRGKADLTKYREAGKQVAEVLQTFTPLLERASVDEAYLDVTEAVIQRRSTTNGDISVDQIKNTHVVGSTNEDFLYNLYNNNLYSESSVKLAYGAALAEDIRSTVFEKTGYRCSAGIAHNKILAKLVCGLHKPNKQTVLPQDNVEELYRNLPVRKITGLGGKFGCTLSEELGIQNMIELLKFSEKQLIHRFDEKTGTWLYNIARGIDLEPVTTRLVSKSIGCCKKFAGRAALVDTESVMHWLSELALEISERLEKDFEENNRKAKQMIISFAQQRGKKELSGSRTHYLSSYDPQKITQDAFDVIKKNCIKSDGSFHIIYMGISTGKFEDLKNVGNITSFFKADPGGSVQKTNMLKKTESLNKIDFKRERVENPDNAECKNDLYNTTDIEKSTEQNDQCSIYSDTTEEDLNEAEQDIVFYDDKFQIQTSELSSINTDVENSAGSSSKLSDVDKRKVNKSSSENTRLQSEESFFKKYIDRLKQDTKNSLIKECAKDKYSDASNKAQNELFVEVVDDKNWQTLEDIKLSPNEIFLPSTTTNTELKEICKDCNKNILTSEMVSHLDYHLALKIGREVSASKQNKVSCDSSKISEVLEDVMKSRSPETHCDILPSTSSNQTLKDICKECNKKVLATDMVSHMDYHFALQMVREEAKLYKESPTLPNADATQHKKVSGKKSAKRKAKSVDNNSTLSCFFKKELESVSGSFEICEKCNKKVDSSDFSSHLDYHAAKKLHLEINDFKANPSENNLKSTKGKNDFKNKQKIRSVTSFFKPL